VLSIDLDGFKRVNDVHGHASGDGLLRDVAARLLEVIHGPPGESSPIVGFDQHLAADAIVSRIGGDEFVVVLERADPPAAIARRIGEALSKSFVVGGQKVFISSSIGVASFPESGGEVAELLERADTALYEAKARGRNNFQFFSQAVVDKTRRRVTIENALRGAMVKAGIGTNPTGECEFRLVFQPKIDLVTREMVGAEALMRWTSSELGFVSPGEFIPIAEDAGLIGDLGKWVLRSACAQAKSWARPTPLHVSVNVSSRQFGEPDFARSVQCILEETGLPPSCLELEVTEGSVMDDPTRSRRILESLKELGVTIALDDFGTGYSSLSYLAKLPIDILKIDRSFVAELGRDPKAGLITTAMLGLARGLEIAVVVEGVETEDQLAFVAEWSPITIQGYLFAKPMPLAELETFRLVRPARAA
jgi:predicted signal transduction protein with EAL and GGDEF domain